MADSNKNDPALPPSFDPCDISMSIQRHDSALEALKDVPAILQTLMKSVRVPKSSDDVGKGQSTWSLGLSEPEDDPDVDINKIINDGKDNETLEGKELNQIY